MEIKFWIKNWKNENHWPSLFWFFPFFGKKIGKKQKNGKKWKKYCKLAIFAPQLHIFNGWLMTVRFSIHLQLFESQKIGFWVKNGKFWIFKKIQICLTSEALVPLLCFPKARKMFVCREELQTMILSTERPLYHVGELRYGPPKFFRVKQKISENAFLSFESSWCVYITKMVLSGTNWSHMENNDHCCHFGGVWQENNLFWA